MGLLKAQTSFLEACDRQSSSSCPRLLPPFTCEAGNLLSRETAWLWVFCPFARSVIFSLTFNLMNVLCFLSEISQCLQVREICSPPLPPVRGTFFQRQSKSQAGGRVRVKVGKLFAPHNN